MTAEPDPLDALEDILQNMELARSFLGDSATVDELEGDPKTLYSVARALEVVGEAPSAYPPPSGRWTLRSPATRCANRCARLQLRVWSPDTVSMTLGGRVFRAIAQEEQTRAAATLLRRVLADPP